MRFSIIIPIYNDSKKLKTTLDSIVAQTYDGFEVIIQNAGAEAETTQIVEYYKKNFGVEIIHNTEHDTGIYDGMNRGVLSANGDYCIFLGAGDRLVNNTVLNSVNGYLNDNKNIDIIYGNIIEIDEDGNENKLARKLNWLYKIKFTPVCHQTVFARRELWDIYKFNLNYKIAADQDWLLKMVSTNRKIQYIDLDIAYYPRDGFSSLRSDQFVEEQKKIHGTYYPFWKTIRFTWRKICGK